MPTTPGMSMDMTTVGDTGLLETLQHEVAVGERALDGREVAAHGRALRQERGERVAAVGGGQLPQPSEQAALGPPRDEQPALAAADGDEQLEAFAWSPHLRRRQHRLAARSPGGAARGDGAEQAERSFG